MYKKNYFFIDENHVRGKKMYNMLTKFLAFY